MKYSSEKYNLLMRFMHWGVGTLILCVLAFGLYIVNLPRDTENLGYYYGMHKSFGVLILFLVSARFCIRFLSSIPALPSSINKRDSMLSSITIFLLYVCMFAMPLSGYLMSNFAGKTVPFFAFTMPSIVDANPEMAGFFRETHEVIAYGLIALIALHILGAIKHAIVEKENLLKRII